MLFDHQKCVMEEQTGERGNRTVTRDGLQIRINLNINSSDRLDLFSSTCFKDWVKS